MTSDDMTPAQTGILLYRFANQNFADPLMPAGYVRQTCEWLHQYHPDEAARNARYFYEFRTTELCDAQHQVGLPAEEASRHQAAAERALHIVLWLTLDVGAPLPEPVACPHGQTFRALLPPEEAEEVSSLLRKFVDQDPDPQATPDIAKAACEWLHVNFPDFTPRQVEHYEQLCVDKQCEAKHEPVSDQEREALLQTAARARVIVTWLIDAGAPAPAQEALCKHEKEAKR